MNEGHIPNAEKLVNPRRIFTLLILYRWFSLIPPFLTLWQTDQKTISFLMLLIAAVVNILISLFPRPINHTLRTHPWLLGFDLLLTAVLIAFSGGWHSPYYLYALSPLLVAAYFFQLRGALLVTTAFLPLYTIGVLASARLDDEQLDWLAMVTAVVGFYLISGTFGYASNLVARLRTARDESADAHRDLEVIHNLTVSLQRAADVEEVQERVLEAVTMNLGFRRAVVGLVDQDKQIITGWLGWDHDGQMLATGGLPHLAQIPLSDEGGTVAGALIDQRVRQVNGEDGSVEGWIMTHFGMTAGRIFPMVLREHAVGVLLVDAAEFQEDPARLRSLQSIASQAAVAIGTTMMCIDRAQRLAVQDERLRIAQDIHDVVSQSLFGIVYTLDGSLKLLPDQPEEVMPELERALRVAEETHNEVRQSILNIWPSEMTAERFNDGLRKYAVDICQADSLQLSLVVDGDFDRLPAQARRGLYRIAQEALANTAHHAAASQSDLHLEVSHDCAALTIQDDGRGFDPETVFRREYDREHFGLRGMQERANTLGGTLHIRSQPGQGTTIQVKILLTKN
ncbi:MAG: GAF domain-containing protein [Chloroflexi bacterium]|nr:GAF domain-containing protein [Chloroflexota bacterium]